jgi:hypothetical protein
MSTNSKTEFEKIEGRFHDGLGTYAEIVLANEIVKKYRINQQLFDYGNCIEKMDDAINRLPLNHRARSVFNDEIQNIKKGVVECANILESKFSINTPAKVLHTPNDFSNGKAADLQIIFSDNSNLLLSIKTDKSGKVAIADGQTPQIFDKWANRFFQMSRLEYDHLLSDLGYYSEDQLRKNYLNVANVVANIMICRLGIIDYEMNDFSLARSTNIDAVRYLLNQLLYYKSGSDNCQVIVIDRSTASVKWETRLDSIDISRVGLSDVSFVPSRPRHGRPISSEFGVKISGQTIVSFQIKHKRGKARDSGRRDEFSDITTRLRI